MVYPALFFLRFVFVYGGLRFSHIFKTQTRKRIKTKNNKGYDYITNDGTVFYFTTNNGADNYRVISMDLNKNNKNNSNENKIEFDVIVPESDKFRLDRCDAVNNGKILVCDYMEDVKTVFRFFNLQGQSVPNKLNFPAAGSVGMTCEPKFTDAFFVECMRFFFYCFVYIIFFFFHFYLT